MILERKPQTFLISWASEEYSVQSFELCICLSNLQKILQEGKNVYSYMRKNQISFRKSSLFVEMIYNVSCLSHILNLSWIYFLPIPIAVVSWGTPPPYSLCDLLDCFFCRPPDGSFENILLNRFLLSQILQIAPNFYGIIIQMPLQKYPKQPESSQMSWLIHHPCQTYRLLFLMNHVSSFVVCQVISHI